ncbi:DNA topoisomerase 2-beta [Thelohanellus kitauei]|uniref:DNA topoisomerase 2 n=1 Tax=Thelohanellus kitauei TaxID=669202 RepID=A0A0C2N7A0_THEKT|nr:DNA topoisomerase 2-beta [Thelohanellus kitauei]
MHKYINRLSFLFKNIRSDDRFQQTLKSEGFLRVTIRRMTTKKKNVEEIYQKKTQIEHILIRPDTYIGSTSLDLQLMWVWDDATRMIVRKNVNFCPGLYKIFDEILVNAADNKQRDPSMTTIKIDFDQIANSITIYNDGKGIPIVIHKEENVYVPTLIFGHLLTSSNFDDNDKKVTGGRNGFGAKLCNIFSHRFTVETASCGQKKKFIQIWQNNMGGVVDPMITDYKGPDYTRVTFCPDLKRFNMTELDSDFVSLLKKRAYDLAGTIPGVKVYLNGELLNVPSFEKYAALYSRADTQEQATSLYRRVNDRWEVCVMPSDGAFQHVSFVNNIATTKGGTHVNHVCNKIVAKLIEDAQKKIKNSKVQLRPQQVKQHLWLFINSKIENPSFDSQTKENLTLNEREFGSTCDFQDKFLKQISDLLCENIVSWYNIKLKSDLNKKGATVKRSKLHGMAKLDDANDAGTGKSLDCTLILTEGDSAKSLAVAGVSVVGRDKYGVFPLRGKVMNIRETSMSNVIKNKEVESLVKIIGLDFKKKYEDRSALSSLRYGKVMFMTDQDYDGSHIKGLLINFFHFLWPNLIKHNFLEQFITPIVKVRKGHDVKAFFSIPEYEEWKNETPDFKSWKVKYYKGLGTSKDIEAKEYFEDLPRHRIKFQYTGAPCEDAIVLAFSKAKVDSRKMWLDNFQAEQARRREFGLPDVYLYQKGTTAVSYCDFVNKELILFSHADNIRSIPSMVDGLKPGQRKVMFASFKRKIKDIKVFQLAGMVSELSAYHHGEQSLVSTIINLAQNFVGTNNINLLLPEGQFGTRIRGGKDASAARYISTGLNSITRAIFLPVDDPILKYLYEDNQMIEPEWYYPIIPMVLVNGSDGIGTGYATKIPNYNPREIIDNLKRMIDGIEPEPMLPWFKNFTGTITEVSRDKVLVSGRAYHGGKDTIVISELPIRVWTQTYKESVLEPLLKGDSNNDSYVLLDYKDYHDEATINYVLKFRPDYLDDKDDSFITSLLKLQTSLNLNHNVLFDASGKLHRYATAIDVLKDFYRVRLEMYIKRKSYMESLLLAEFLKLQSQERFIDEKISNKIVIEKKKKIEMIHTLKTNSYPSDPVKAFFKTQNANKPTPVQEEIDEGGQTEEADTDEDYEYLLGMPLWSLTYERQEKLKETRLRKQQELENLRGRSPQQLWLEDLDNLLEAMDKLEEEEIKLKIKTQKKTNIKKIKTPVRTREINCQKLADSKNIPVFKVTNVSDDNLGVGEDPLLANGQGVVPKITKPRKPRAPKDPSKTTKPRGKAAKAVKEPKVKATKRKKADDSLENKEKKVRKPRELKKKTEKPPKMASESEDPLEKSEIISRPKPVRVRKTETVKYHISDDESDVVSEASEQDFEVFEISDDD